jgi:uroporphyrinogen decarboxylase
VTSRERISKLLNHETPDRIGIYDHYWWEAIERWRREGLPESVEPPDYFEMDIAEIGFDSSFQFPEKVIFEDQGFKVVQTSWGYTERTFKDHQTTPQFLEFACKTRQEWFGKYRDLMMPSESRLGDIREKLSQLERFRERGKYVCLSQLESFEAAWRMIGMDNLLMSMAADPEWINDVFMTYTDMLIGTAEMFFEKIGKPNGFWAWGDIGYRNAMLFSPKMYRELLMPAHAKLFGFAHRNGLKVIYHGCGNQTESLPLLIESGIDCIQPLEVKAGNDLPAFKKEYGDKISFMGGIDVRKLGGTWEECEEELKTKISVAKTGGGYIYHSDHSVIPQVSWERYRKIIDLAADLGKY